MFGKTQTARVGNTDAVSLVRFLISVISTDGTKPDRRFCSGDIARLQFGVPVLIFTRQVDFTVEAAPVVCRFVKRRLFQPQEGEMSEQTAIRKSSDEQIDAAVKFVQKLGGIEQAKRALDELKKLRKTG